MSISNLHNAPFYYAPFIKAYISKNLKLTLTTKVNAIDGVIIAVSKAHKMRFNFKSTFEAFTKLSTL